MENSDKGRNPWRRNHSQLRPSQAYRQASGMSQDTGVANTYSNHLGQPSYQLNRVPETSWYGSQPNPDPNAHSDSWNWGTDSQQNRGQQFQESYQTRGQQHYPQQAQPQNIYQSYDHHNHPPVDVPAQPIPMQQQWHGVYQGQHGMPMNNMGYQQYDQSHLTNVDNRNQNNVGTMPVSGNGNGSGDLWNWGVDDSQPIAGEWGGNEEAWDWTIPGAETPTSVPTPVPTPGPPQQRLVQGSAEEPQATPAVLIKQQVNDQPTEPAPMLRTNPPSTNEGMISQVQTPSNNLHLPPETPKVEESKTQSHTADSRMEKDGSWGGWAVEGSAPDMQHTREDMKQEMGAKESDALNVNKDRWSPENFIQQENLPQGNNGKAQQSQQPAPLAQQYPEVKTQPLTSTSEITPGQNLPPQNAADVSQNPEVVDTSRPEYANPNEMVQEFTIQQHTDANHNELLLLEVSQQMNEETHSYDQWWQNPENTHGSLDDASQSSANAIADSRPNNVEVNSVQTIEAKHKSPKKGESQASLQPVKEKQWSQQLESDSLAQLTDDLTSFSINTKREMGEGTPAEDEPVPTSQAIGAVVQDDLILDTNADHHKKDLSEDGANLETLPDNKERLDDEEPTSKFSRHPDREASGSWTQGIAQPENQEVAPPKVDVVPSSASSFVLWQPGVARQRTPEEGGQETRSTAQQRSLGMAARSGAPSPRPTVSRASRPAHMVGSREDARAPRPKYLQSHASPSPSSISQQQSTADLLASKPISQQRPIAARRPADDTPLPSDRNQYLETGQLRDEEEDEEDEDPCGPPSSQRPPPGLRRMVPGESSSPEAGGASASGSGMCLPVGSIAGHNELVDDDDDDVLDEVPIPSGPRVVPGVAEGEEDNTRDDGVGQVPEGSQTSAAAINSGVVQPVTEVPNSERSETIGSEGGAVPTLMTSLSRDPADDRRGSYSRGESRRDVSAERDRATTHSKVQPSHIVGGESEEEEEKESGEGERGSKGRRIARRRAGRMGRERTEREEGEVISDDEDGDDGSGRRSVEEREVQEKNRTRRRDHGKGYPSNKADRRPVRDDADSGDDYGDDRDTRDDSRREDKRRGGREYDEHRQRHSNRLGYEQETDPGEDPGGYYRGSHPSRRHGGSEWDRHRQRSNPPEERGHHDDRIGGRHDYPPQDWPRDTRHREWGPEDEYARDYYGQRHPNAVSSRPHQSYYRDGQRSRTNSQLDLGGNGYDGRPSSRGGEGYYSDTNRDGGWERRNRGGERGGAGLRRESAERDSGTDWHDRDSRTPRHHYPSQYSHHLRPEPPYYGGDPRYAPDSRQYSPYSPGGPYPGYEYYNHPLQPGQLPHHPYYNTPYHMHRDSYNQAYMYYEDMRRNRPHEYAEWYRKFYGRASGTHAGTAGSNGTPGGRTPSASGGAVSPVGIPRSEAGGEGGHSLEETNLADDGRGSVHSGRSSLNLLQPGMDDDSASGRKLDADRSLGSPFRGTEPISSRASTPQRLTPAKFPTAHIKASLTTHGSLLLLKPNYLIDGPSSTVEFLSLKELLKNDPVMAELEDFPGPLIRGTTHKNSVIQFCNSKINTALNDSSIHDRESYILLWKLLILLLKQNGFVVGTDISSLLLEDSAYLQNPSHGTTGSATGSASPQLPPEELSSNSNLTTPDEGIVVGGPASTPTLSNRAPQFSEEYLTRKFREFLLFGNTRDALEWAMKHGLWGHAMFLAYKIGGRMLASVLTRFANNLPHNDPLQTLYQLLSGRQPAAITSCSDEKWGDWRPHLAMIISNSSSHPDLHRKSIITLGDTLAARGCHHASQFCYITAQLNLGASSSGTPASAPSDLHSLFSGPDARLVLFGSSVSLSPDSECHVPNEVVNCTEVLEYARSLADPGFCFPYFQPVKLEYAMQLVEHGMVQEGLLYCEAISTKVTSWLMSGGVDKTLNVQFLRRLEELSDRLKHHDPVLERSEGSGDVDPQWIQELKRCIKMMEDHSQGLLTGAQQTNNMAGMYGTQPTMDVHGGQISYNTIGSDGTANNQTELSGQGVMQVGEYDAQQWNNYYYQQANWQQQQLQQQQPQQQQQLATQQEAVNSTQETVAPSNTNQVSTAYETSVWDPGQTSTNNIVSNEAAVSASGEGQESVIQQTVASAPASNSLDMNTRSLSGVAQPSSDKNLSSSEGGSANYWDMATSNDQSERGVRRREEVEEEEEEDEEDEDDCDDEEDDEETEEEEDDFVEDHRPARKDVTGQQRPSSTSSAPASNWRASDSSQKPKKDSLDVKGGSVGGGASGGSGWLGGLLSKLSLRPKNQMNLPDDKNPSIVWDNEKKRWVNMDADEDEATGDLPPPPKAADLIPTINPSSGATNTSAQSGSTHGKSIPSSIASSSSVPPVNNMYKMQRGRKMRQNYVDVMGSSSSKSGNRGTLAPPLDLFPGSVAPAPTGNFFVPAPVHDDSAPTDFLTAASAVDNDTQETSEMSRSSSMSSLSREVQGFMAPDRRGHGVSVGYRPMATAKPSVYQENQYHQQSSLHY